MIPDFQSAMLPLLEKMQDGNTYDSSLLRNHAISHFKITEEEQQTKTPNDKQILFFNRIAWAISYLRTGGLIFSPERGKYKISDLGLKVLKRPPQKITIRFLKEINPNKSTENIEEANPSNEQSENLIQTPDEMIEEGYKRIKVELSKLLLKTLEEISPYKFEDIVLNLVRS